MHRFSSRSRFRAAQTAVFCLAFAALESSAVSQQAPPASRAHVWKAFWITSSDVAPRAQSVLHFRKQIVLKTKPDHFIVHVSADNQFQLRVNGRLAGRGPSIGDLQHWKYETYDIAPLLNSGPNLIAATVWNWGDAAPLRQITDRTGFVLDGDTDQEDANKEASIRTDTSWQVEVEKGVSTLPKPPALRQYYYVAPPGELLDGNLLDRTWDQVANQPPPSGAASSSWKPASIVTAALGRGQFAYDANWQLVPDGLPAMELAEQPTGKVVRGADAPGASSFPAGQFPEGPLSVPTHSAVTLLIDAGQLTTAYPELILSGGKNSTVTLQYAEALYDANGAKGNRSEIAGKHIGGLVDEIHPGGSISQSFIPLDWRTWRYLQIDIKTGDDALTIDRLRTWFTAYPFKEVAAFDSDDAALKQIWNIGWHTARLCAHDTYMDTPYWERLQYTGDTRIQTLLSYVMTGDDRLARQAIEAFHNSTTSDGIPLSRYPSTGFQIIPAFSMYWVGMVHDYWMYRPDREFVRAQLPVMRSTIEWFLNKQNSNSLLGRLPWWPFVDWVDDFGAGVPPQDEDGNSAILSLQLIEALRYAAEIEDALGSPELGRRDAESADKIAEAVKNLCWSDKDGLLADTPAKNHFSQHANAYAVWLDVIPKDKQRAVMTKVFAASDSSFVPAAAVPVISAPVTAMSKASYYYRFYLSRALVHAGMGDSYLDTLAPWKGMMANGLTTWAEQPEPTRSDSHAWSAHPNYDLLTIVAGITPAEPGFKSVRIEPHPGKLRRLHAVMASPSGDVDVELEVHSQGVDATVTLPAGLTGNLVWDGKAVPLASGVQHLALLPGN